jgi:cyclomaltodextrinase / maltogenic alpha-amylase / neopullulanase
MLNVFFGKGRPLLLILLSAAMLSNCREKTMTQLTFENAPEWAAQIVWYQIFPDRFNNGDPMNDPDLASIDGSWPHDNESPWQPHPWESDWYALQPWEKTNGKDIWHNIQRRRYGGDIQGIIDKLDYLKDLGIGGLYINPLFQAPSLHKYDGACYHHIDVHFGPDPKGDLALMAQENPTDPSTWAWTEADKLALKLIDEAHKRGIRIIFDGVFNHMGINSFAFQDIVKNGKSSKYAGWFTISDWNKKSPLGFPFTYEGWYGVQELPELRENELGIVKAPKDYIFAATRRWMDPDGDGNPADGIDGWRLDVAFCVGHPFWKDWRKLVKSINPQAYLTAEIIDTPEKTAPYLQGDEFDAVMNYNFAFAASDFFINDHKRISATQFQEALRSFMNHYSPEMLYVMQNLYDSHDTQRVLSAIVNRDLGSFRNWGEFFALSQATNSQYQVKAPGNYEKAVLRNLIVFQMTFPGAPMVYYGTEAGMWGANDPCCRKPMVWPEIDYQPEKTNPDRSLRQPDEVKFDKSLHAFYRKLIHLRNDMPLLQTGDFQFLPADDEKELFAYRRFDNTGSVFIVFNRSAQEHTYGLHWRYLNGKRKADDFLTGNTYSRNGDFIKVIVPPLGALILR